MSVIQIRPYEKGDESAIVELLNTVFKGWHSQLKCSSMDFWRWKYIKNPYTKNFTVLTIDDERVVGCFHGLTQRIKIGEKIYLSSSGTDLAVEEAYRNKGLYKKMRALQRELEKNNVFFHYGVSNNIVLAKINLRENHGFLPYPPYVYMKIKDINLHIKKTRKLSFQKKLGYKGLNLFNKLTNMNRTIGVSEIDVRQITSFGENADRFWGKIAGDYNFIVERSRQYLNWRYCDPQCDEYNVLEATENGEMLGYAVLRIVETDEDYLTGFIVDLLTLSDREDAVTALTGEAVRFFEEKNINIVQWQITKDHPNTRIASRYGFLNSRIVNPLDYPRETTHIEANEERLQQSPPNKIHFIYGDSDWV